MGKPNVIVGGNQVHYTFVIQNEKYFKLLAHQSKPVERYFFKDKEISVEDLVKKLESID